MLLHSLNGIDVGNINLSKIFPIKFLPIVGEEVKLKLKSFFLPQDYLKLAVYQLKKIAADKATHKHRTRLFICFITCVPDSDNLI